MQNSVILLHILVFVHIPLFPMLGNVFAVDLVVNYILICFVGFQKRVLQKLVELKNKIIEIEHKLRNTTTDSEILDVLDEPMNSLREFQAIEERLTDVEFRRKLEQNLRILTYSGKLTTRFTKYR